MVPRIGMPGASLGTEALHGLGIAANPSAPTGSFMPVSTQFPQVFGLGESWDPDVMKTVGATVGYEARVYNARGVSDTGRGIGIITRGPNVDLCTTRAGAAPRSRSARIRTWSARWRRATWPAFTATIPR